MQDDLLSLLPKMDFSRREFVMTSLAAGFALAVQPVRVHLVRLPRSMTITEFNQSYPSKIPVAQVALINGVEPTTQIPAGTMVKRVQ